MKEKIELGKTKLALLNLIKNKKYVAVHEASRFLRNKKIYCNENAIASRLWEMSRDGFLHSKIRYGKKYKEWYL